MARRIYVAGPISKGDVFANIRAAIEAGEALRRAGLLPFVPHLAALWHMIYPVPYEDWLTYDAGWIEVCDALLRIPGESAGADREMSQARGMGIPIYYTVDECIEAERKQSVPGQEGIDR